MATGGQSSSHPCHNLSNPSKRLFWCRHCMTKFIDPIQRWRHSKTCKKIVSSNPRQEIVSTDGRILQVVAGTTEGSVVVSNLAPPQEPEPSVSKRKIRKLVMNDLKCQICERVFISLDEMREHVKHPCRKYKEEEVIPVTGVSITLPDFEQKDQHEDEEDKASALTSLEANLQQMEQSLAMRSDVADEVVANQIESLLKAAQVLQQQQQQEQQSTTYQLLGADDLGNVDSQYVITTNPDHDQDGQFEAVTVETVATLENIVPQVAMCPDVAQQQVVLQPNIEPDDLQLISEVIAREEPEIGKHHSFVSPSSRTPSTSSPPPYSESAAEPSGEVTSPCQEGSPTDNSDVSPAVGDRSSTNCDSMLSECVPNSSNTEDSNDVTKSGPSNCCENGCCYDPTVDDFGFRNLRDDIDGQKNEPIRPCTCKLKSSPSKSNKSPSKPAQPPSKYKVHETAKKMRTRSISMEEKKSVPNKVVKKKRKYIGGRGSLDCVARSKRKKLKKSAPQNKGESDSNTAQTSGEPGKQNSDEFTAVKDPNVIKQQNSDSLVELDRTLCNEKSQNLETKVTGSNSNVSLPKVVTRKPKPAREPKCRICDRVFKSVQLLQKHNKVPCKIKHTRNLCQKVLRPKRAPVENVTSLKQKLKQNLPNKKNKTVLRPQLLPVRRISDTTLFILPKAKKGGKKRRKSAPVFIYSPPVKEYKNTFLGIHTIYKSLPFKEKFFFDLGMISTEHLTKDSCESTKTDVCESFSTELGLQSSSQEITDVDGPCTPPPILEKIPDLDIFSVYSPSSCSDLEPPILEVISDLQFQDSTSNSNSLQPKLLPLPRTPAEDVLPILKTYKENKTSNIRTNDPQSKTPENSVLHSEQSESNENDKERTPGCRSQESVQEQMTEIFTKYFTSPNKQKHKPSFKSVEQTDLFSSKKLPKESPNDQKIKFTHNQDEIPDIVMSDFQSSDPAEDPTQTDVEASLLPEGDVGNQSCANSEQNESQKTGETSQQSLTVIDLQNTIQTDCKLPDHLDTVVEQPEESQTAHFLQEDVALQNFVLDGNNSEYKENSLTELPPSAEISIAESQEPQKSIITVPCDSDICMIVDTDVERHHSTQPVTHDVTVGYAQKVSVDGYPKKNLSENIQSHTTPSSSPCKSSTNRHFTDLLADLCSPQSEGMTVMDPSIWVKVQPPPTHSDKEASSSAKTKDSQKLGERHFMDAIMTAAVDIDKTTASAKNNTVSTSLFRKVQKVTVAVQTDAESFTEKMLQSSNNSLTSRTDQELLCSDMVGSETFETVCVTRQLEPSETVENNKSLENSDNERRDINTCSHSVSVQNVPMETCPVQLSSKEGGTKEFSLQNVTSDNSSSTNVVISLCPTVCQSQPSQKSCSSESSTKPGSSTESSPQKSEGRNLFESLFSSLGKESDSNNSTGVPLSNNSTSHIAPCNDEEAVIYSLPQNTKHNIEEAVIYSSSSQSNTHCNIEEAVIYSIPQNTTHNIEEAVINSPSQSNNHCSNEEAVIYSLPQNITHCNNEEAVTYSPPPTNTHSNSQPHITLQKDTSLKERLPQNLHVPQPNGQEVLVFPPPGSKITVPAPDSPPPHHVGRTTSLPLGLSRDVPDVKNRTNLLEMVAKSLGIYSDENQDPQTMSSASGQTALSETVVSSVATKNSVSENSSVFVNIPCVQSTSCVGEAEDSSVQIIVMNNQSTPNNYTTNINVIDLPTKEEVTKLVGNPSDLLHPSKHISDLDSFDQNLCVSQNTYRNCRGTCAKDVSSPLSKCFNVVVDKNVSSVTSKLATVPSVTSKLATVPSVTSKPTTVPSVTSKPVTSQKPGVKVVICGVEDLKKWNNSGIVVTNKSSSQIDCVGQTTDSEETWDGVDSGGVSQQRENQTDNLCNTPSLSDYCNKRGLEQTDLCNEDGEEPSLHPPNSVFGSLMVGQNSSSSLTCSSTTSYLTPVINVSCGSPSPCDPVSCGSPSPCDPISSVGVHPNAMVTDIHLSTVDTRNVSHPVTVTEEGNRPVPMVTGEEGIESDVAMVAGLDSVTTEEVCSGSWGEPKVMVQYVQGFDCDENVSYIVLDNEQKHGSDPFVITESSFLQTGETILCSEEESLLNSKEQLLPAAVMN